MVTTKHEKTPHLGTSSLNLFYSSTGLSGVYLCYRNNRFQGDIWSSYFHPKLPPNIYRPDKGPKRHRLRFKGFDSHA